MELAMFAATAGIGVLEVNFHDFRVGQNHHFRCVLKGSYQLEALDGRKRAVIGVLFKQLRERALMVEIERIDHFHDHGLTLHDTDFCLKLLGGILASAELLLDQIFDADVGRPAQIDMETGSRFVLGDCGDNVEDGVGNADGEPDDDNPLALDKNLAKVGRRDNRMTCDWCCAAAYRLLWSLGGNCPALHPYALLMVGLCSGHLRPHQEERRKNQQKLRKIEVISGSPSVTVTLPYTGARSFNLPIEAVRDTF